MKQPLSPWMQRLVLLSHLALIVAMTWVNPPIRVAVLVAPLLLPLPGLFKGRDYTYAWTTMLLAFYVGGWLAAGYYNPSQKWISFGIAACAAVDFAALNLFVKFRARERSLVVRIATRREGDQVALVVEDNGIGLDNESARHAFEPYFRAYAAREIPGHGGW